MDAEKIYDEHHTIEGLEGVDTDGHRRALAAVVAAAKAEAWDEGWVEGQRSDFSENPYTPVVGGENR